MKTNSPAMLIMTIRPGTVTTRITITMLTIGRSLKEGMPDILTVVVLTMAGFARPIMVAALPNLVMGDVVSSIAGTLTVDLGIAELPVVDLTGAGSLVAAGLLVAPGSPTTVDMAVTPGLPV